MCLICTLYYSGGLGVAPLTLSLIQATLVWHLYSLSTDHLEEPLAAFGMALPSGFVSLSIFGQYVGGSLTPYIYNLWATIFLIGRLCKATP